MIPELMIPKPMISERVTVYINGSDVLKRERIVRCENCKHYQGECCVRFGRSAICRREPYDFCSKGEPKK